ncbi:MAG: hypothetical protein IPF92_25865 [Myxococcales bacterium]|nr:hypothetical protein [Myxococcales bacterium]
MIRSRVLSVEPQSIAGTAGLRSGDLVIAIDGRDARALSVSGVFAFIHFRPLRSEAKLVGDRDGKGIPISLHIIDTPPGKP